MLMFLVKTPNNQILSKFINVFIRGFMNQEACEVLSEYFKCMKNNLIKAAFL